MNIKSIWTKMNLSLAGLLGFGLIALMGCSQSSDTSQADTLKIGFILDNMQEERYEKDKRFFEEAARSLGAEVVFASANSSVAKQMNAVENMLTLGVDALVIQPVDSNAAVPMVKSAHAENVPVIAYDRIIKNVPIDLYVTQDSFKVGVLQAEAAVKATGAKGKFVILSGAQGHSVAETITKGAFSVLKNFPQIEVVVHQYHQGWSTKLAMDTTENAMTRFKDDIQAVLANNSGMARGAVQAVAAQGKLGQVFIAGADADLASIKDIISARQDFEVLKAIEPLARAAAEAAVKLAKKEEVKFDTTMENGSSQTVKVINTPVFGITKDNVEEMIINTGFHSRDSLYGENQVAPGTKG